ncbi:filamentous hemagglutinin N-terminal domain-containing protein [Lusitaniella coriacea LEGE 07157]|uniref:Filamentous hemagglutinin N-terminal domain-containing protein n=1 Tax=Lusitaniella coriacea LEGE 07157 TaxID=945747 RepID=A0A8J7DVT6_9CYAN|nr:filamentous hemagglutinin N-terminal domain-containing protein [Lusitaniella coriacea]MBE9116031.1 filamentous hemagglutinin N-terminal domain-containing protein [Lusitaniella coriacea LEGE 07157]
MMTSQTSQNQGSRILGAIASKMRLCEIAGLLSLIPLSSVQAQLLPDNTLGAERSIVTPIDRVRDRIEGGAIRDINLFHSFLEFNIGNNRSVYFANPPGVENILTRVTGVNPSNILGTLGVLGSANLFLINPNGIYFGENARLDVSGSFLATTADSIQLGSQGYFSATDIQGSQLLSVQPSALFSNALRNWTADIHNRGNLSAGGDLTLIAERLDLQGKLFAGGNLTLVGANLTNSPWNLQTNIQQNPSLQGTVQIRDSKSNPFIAAAGETLLLQGNQTLDIFALNHTNSGLFSGGDMVLKSANPVAGDTHYNAGGNFRIEQLDGSLGDLFSPNDPVIRASGDVSFTSYTGTSLHIFAGGSVNAGSITVTGADTIGNSINPTSTPNLANVRLSDNATTVNINGNAQPTLDIRAGTTALGTPGLTPPIPPGFNPPTPVIGTTATRADINIGTITNRGGIVLLTNQYEPNTLNGNITVGSINTSGFLSGSVSVDSRGELTLNNGVNTSGLFGNGGDVTLLSGETMTLNNGVDTSGLFGNGGDITLLSGGNLTLNDSVVASSLFGNGGDVTFVSRGNLALNPGSDIFSVGELGGNITLRSDRAIFGTNSPIVSASTAAVPGMKGGDIQLIAQSLDFQDGAVIASATLGAAQSGNIFITVSDTASIINNSGANDTGIATTTAGTGDSGSITLNARRLIIRSTFPPSDVVTGIATSSLVGSTGNTGNITLNISESIDVTGNEPGQFNPKATTIDEARRNALEIFNLSTGITTATTGEGNAGMLRVNAGQLSVRNGAGVTAGVSTTATGNGGGVQVNIAGTVELQGKVALGGTTISSGNAGEVVVNARNITLRDGAVISSDTLGAGDAANLTVNATQLSIFGGSRIGAATGDRGNGATVRVTASDFIEIVGTSATDSSLSSGLFTNTIARGNAGNLEISASRVTVREGGAIAASTTGTGQAGILNLNATESVEVIGTSGDGRTPSRLFFDSAGSGDAGQLNVSTRSLLARDSAQVSAATSGTGQGGILTLNATESVEVSDGAGLFFDSRGAGNARGIRINTGRLQVQNQGQVTVSGTGTGISGSLEIFANSIFLNNQGRLRATTTASDGGNIRLQVAESIVLRNNSEISAEAFGNANGGNIDMAVGGFVLAVLRENSDVVASAVSGRGGNIQATAEAILGFREFQGQRTPESDFTATSQLGAPGGVDVQQPPQRFPRIAPDLLNVDALSQDVCSLAATQQSSFTRVGRGGLSPNPADTYQPFQGVVNWAEFNRELTHENSEIAPVVLRSREEINGSPQPQEIRPARGWMRSPDGTVLLTANVPTVRNESLKVTNCQEFNEDFSSSLNSGRGGVRKQNSLL